jgi:hypothetical protein
MIADPAPAFDYSIRRFSSFRKETLDATNMAPKETLGETMINVCR